MSKLLPKLVYYPEELLVNRPEKNLLLAMLDRAVRDLKSRSLLEVTEALAWFSGADKFIGFTYAQVLLYCSFSAVQIKFLEQKIEEGYVRQKQISEKRKQDRLAELERKGIKLGQNQESAGNEHLGEGVLRTSRLSSRKRRYLRMALRIH